MREAQEQRRFDVTIAGEINLDLILSGLPRAMPVERELLATGFQMTLGGSSAITAHNLSLLGMRVGFVTRVGKDEMGQLAMRRIAESGVDLSASITAEKSGTGVTLLPRNNGGDDLRLSVALLSFSLTPLSSLFTFSPAWAARRATRPSALSEERGTHTLA